MQDPVLVVGAGPTGMTAALELFRLGVPVRLIDKTTPPPPGTLVPDRSRAVHVQPRTLELLEMRGLSQELVRSGHPAAGVSVYGRGRRLFRFDFGHVDSRYNFALFVSQTQTERVLREALEKTGVAIERGVELVGFTQDELARTPSPSPVSLVLRHPDGRLEEARTPWLVDAEGAHSVVRTTLALPFEGRTFEQTYALGDVRVETSLSEGDYHLFSSQDGFLGLFPLGHGRFRIVASKPPTIKAEGDVPSVEELQAIYDRRSPVPARISDIRWGSWFHINSRIVNHTRIGRLLLGGDAAHIHSPAGGQGMNTGIQDMINLAWKLALVVHGRAPMALLDTFEAERLAVERRVLRVTEMVSNLIGASGPVHRGVLGYLGPWIARAPAVREFYPSHVSQLAVSYRASPLSAHHGHLGQLHAGDRLPDLRVRSRTAHGQGYDDRSLFEIVDSLRFTLLVVYPQANGAGAGDWREAIRPWQAIIQVAEVAPPSSEAERERFTAVLGRAGGVVLVRPDGYVGFVGGKHATGRHLAAYCRRWLTMHLAPVSGAAA